MAAARAKLRDAAFVVIPLGIDLVSKFVAYRFLPTGQPVQRDALFQLVLRLNPTGLGSWPQRILAGQRPQMLLTSAAAFAGLTLALVAVRRMKLPLVAKIVSCVAAAAVPAFAVVPLALVSSPWSARSVLIVLGLSRSALLIIIWVLLAPSFWKHAVGLLSATALGNLAGLLLPPYAIVNFMYSEPVHRFLGFGIFSVADLNYLMGLGLLLIAGLKAFHRLLAPARRDGAQTGPIGDHEGPKDA